MSARRTLVAGIGNVFLGDDGFGVEVVRRLGAGAPLPGGDRVEIRDIGVRGVHLAYQLLDGYGTVVLVDTLSRGLAPGTVSLVAPDAGPLETGGPPPLDGHRMGPDTVLALLATLSAGTGASAPERILVVGCEPASLAEGIGLSEPVAAAVDPAAALVREVLATGEPAPEPSWGAGRPRAAAAGAGLPRAASDRAGAGLPAPGDQA
ncbi:hydrogenase maturation protease [Streptomyces sp. NPDC057638]|uniref:hydrogenase maturation protease n=1 Tax=Streptomyces sp. NPDC057638 TaxID=3346190 RepID=UPI0036B15096